MSRSFRESHLSKCSKPWRSWVKGRFIKPVRSLKRNLDNMYDEEGTPIVPRLVSRKWMGDFAWREWRLPDYQYQLVHRNNRKFLLKKKDFEPDEYYWTRSWGGYKR